MVLRWNLVRPTPSKQATKPRIDKFIDQAGRIVTDAELVGPVGNRLANRPVMKNREFYERRPRYDPWQRLREQFEQGSKFRTPRIQEDWSYRPTPPFIPWQGTMPKPRPRWRPTYPYRQIPRYRPEPPLMDYWRRPRKRINPWPTDQDDRKSFHKPCYHKVYSRRQRRYISVPCSKTRYGRF